MDQIYWQSGYQKWLPTGKQDVLPTNKIHSTNDPTHILAAQYQLGTNDTAKAILNGHFEAVKSTNDYVAILLEEGLSKIEGYTPIPLRICPEELANVWKNAKERTLLPHGLINFCYYKAIATHPELLHFETAMMNIAMKSGYAYKQWHTCTDVMILKKVNSIRVDKLCTTIVLFKADFNMLNKCITKKMAHHAEKLKAIAVEQFGSRKRHKPVEHTLNKRIALDLLLHQKKSARSHLH